jgi:ATP-dependent Clp protease ATP-binding subunit ClpB
LALGNDNAYIEPVHLLAAMLRQDDGPKRCCSARASMCPACWAPTPPSSAAAGAGAGPGAGGPELGKLLQATEKEAIKRGDQFIASELFLLAVADHKGDLGQMANAPTA